jgi:hypothetical protein
MAFWMQGDTLGSSGSRSSILGRPRPPSGLFWEAAAPPQAVPVQPPDVICQLQLRKPLPIHSPSFGNFRLPNASNNLRIECRSRESR